MLEILTVQYWSDRLYPNLEQRDPAITFINKVQLAAKDNFVILDLGAGAGELNRYNLKEQGRKIYGIDLDPRIAHNKTLDLGVLGNGDRLPFKDGSFDLIFCIYVLEHIENPELFAKEISRVLKPGGNFMALTPNKYHYVPLIAKLTPTSFHKRLNQKRGRAQENTFETFYKLNSNKDFKKYFSNNFHSCKLDFLEVRPNYLLFSLILFFLGFLYEKIVNSSNLFDNFRVNIIANVSKPNA